MMKKRPVLEFLLIRSLSVSVVPFLFPSREIVLDKLTPEQTDLSKRPALGKQKWNNAWQIPVGAGEAWN